MRHACCAAPCGSTRWWSSRSTRQRRCPATSGKTNFLTNPADWRLAEIELNEAGVNKVTQLAASGRRAGSLSEATAGRLDRSRRERRITELVAQGLPTAAIAAQLYLSTYTVQDHLKSIFETLDISSRGQLVAVRPSLRTWRGPRMRNALRVRPRTSTSNVLSRGD
jgi:DNA-binding CsgD family transcriptional regulator